MEEDNSTEIIFSDHAYKTLTKEMPTNKAKKVVSRLETVAYSDYTESKFEHSYGTNHLRQVQQGDNRVVTAYYINLDDCNISILYSLLVYKKSQMEKPPDELIGQMNQNAKNLGEQLKSMTAEEIRSTIDDNEKFHLELPESIQPS